MSTYMLCNRRNDAIVVRVLVLYLSGDGFNSARCLHGQYIFSSYKLSTMAT